MQTPTQTSKTAPILVTGGTGTLGRQVVDRLRERGRAVRVLSRHALEGQGAEHVAADLATGAGVASAMADVDTVMHLAGSAKGDDLKARHVTEAARRAGVRHLVYVSVVGADRIPVRSALDRMMFGYFAAKHAAAEIIENSGLAWTTLRATQFHDLTFQTVEAMAKLPVVPVPAGWRFQPIDSGEVAERLTELALGEPSGLAPEIGGPEIHDMADLVRSYQRAVGRSRPILRLPLPGRAAATFRGGANLVPDRAIGRRTWEDYLADRLGARVAPVSAPTS